MSATPSNHYRTADRVQNLSASQLGLPVENEAAPRHPSGAPAKSSIEGFAERIRAACAKLIGVTEGVADEIIGAFAASKHNMMFYGPPGTGKTELAKDIARILHETEPRVVTASADWSSTDLVGGYRPAGNGAIKFMPGVLLEFYDRPTIIDELNRCDIDKVVGPLFTLLAEGETTLPFAVWPGKDDRRITIVFGPSKSAEADKYVLLPAWTVLATINTTDKSSLYQMSFALMRRFAWIHVPVPGDKQAVIDYFRQRGEEPATTTRIESPIAGVWDAICDYRQLGAAPFLDILKYLAEINPALDLNSLDSAVAVEQFIRGLRLFVAPLLDGMSALRVHALCNRIAEVIGIEQDGDAIGGLRMLLCEINGVEMIGGS